MSLQDKQYENAASGFAEGATKGLEDFFVKPEMERQKDKLEMQMFSKRIEMEHAAKQQDDAVQQALKAIPPDQFQAVMNQGMKFKKSLAEGTAPEPIDTTNITHPAAQSLLEGLVTHNDSAGNTTRPMDIDGRQVLVTTDAKGNIKKKTDLGLTKKSQGLIQEASAKFNEADGLLTSIGDVTKGFLTATGLTSIPAQYAGLKFNQIAQSDPKAAAYFASTLSHAQRIEKLITGSSRVSSDLVVAAEQSIPTMADTIDTAQAKIGILRQIFNTTHEAALKAYSTNPSEILKDFDEDHFGGLTPKDKAPKQGASDINSMMDFNKFYEMRHPELQKK